MKKILFIMKYPLSECYSLKHKFNGQINAAKALGYDTYNLACDKKYIYLVHDEKYEKIKSILFATNKYYINTKAFIDIFISVLLILKKKKFDIVYMRICPLSYIGYKMCRKIASSSRSFIIEDPSYSNRNIEQKNNVLNNIYSIYSNIWWRKIYKYIDLFSIIGDHADYIHGIRAINIANGVCVNDVPLKFEHSISEPYHFIVVASMSYWHGYDRLIKGIALINEKERKKVIIDMVGDEGDGSLSVWKEMIKKYKLSENFVFHGRVEGKALDQIFDIADVGISSLGMYRAGYKTASVLKLREYAARGLPFVYAHDDPLLNENLWFALKVPNDDRSINIIQIIKFINEVSSNEGFSEEIRNYAKNYMSWESQLEKVFAKL